MPLLGFIYAWSRISAIVVISVMGLKGLMFSPTAEIVEAPIDAGFGWERTTWFSDDTTRPDMPDPLQVQIDRCEKIGENAPGTKARFFCKIQTVKLQGVRYVVRIMKKIYSIANAILPTFGLGGYVAFAELLILGGFVVFAVKTQLGCLKMLTEKASAICQSVAKSTRRAGLVQPDPTEDGGSMVLLKDDAEEQDSTDLGMSHEADRMGIAGGEDQAFSRSSGGRCFHGELAFQEGIGEEVAASSEVSSSEVDGKMKKEVRFCDDSFDDHGISDTYISKTVIKGPQRRSSPVKRVVSEPVSKNCSVKMTRSVSASGTGPGSRSSRHP